MRALKKKFLMPVALLAALLTSGSVGAMADSVTIGNGATNNCIPFVCNFGPEYQQVYSSSRFLGPVSIFSITFFPSSDGTPPATGISSFFTASLSTTSAAVGGLSVTLANNLGSDNQVFFTGNPGGSFTITASTNFFYDPNKGNLLLDIMPTSFGPPGQFAFGFDPNTSRATPAPDGGGLLTRFDFTPEASSVPEPSSLLLLGTGLLSVVSAAHRKWLG